MSSSSSPTPKILLTGATGYIGGSILHHLLTNPESAASQSIPKISCLVRSPTAASTLTSTYGPRVTPLLFRDVDDTDTIERIAATHDIVINALVGYHARSAVALVNGLGRRRKRTGNQTYIIHTSGTSNLADRHITEQRHADRIFHDDNNGTDAAIYDFELAENNRFPYPQRTAELALIHAAISQNVRTLVIMSPLIYGIGTGTGHRSSIQIPWYIKATLQAGHGIQISDGLNKWGYIHISDLVSLYSLALLDFLTGALKLPTGKQGIIFSATGEFAWGEVSRGVADAAERLGRIGTSEVKVYGLVDGANVLLEGDDVGVEMAACSNARTRAVVAERVLGWKAVRTEGDWRAGFEEEIGEFWMDWKP